MAVPVTPNEMQQYVLQARDDLFGGGWQERNFPLGHEEAREKNTCPHTQLMIESAKLVGITPVQIHENAWRFCGQHVVEVNDLGPLSGRQGTEFHPSSFCQRLFAVLERLAQLAEFEAVPVIIGENGKLEITLKAASIEEMDGLYQRVRQSITKVHFLPVLPQISEQVQKFLEIFGRRSTTDPKLGKLTSWYREIFFSASQGCSLAPKDDFAGIMS